MTCNNLIYKLLNRNTIWRVAHRGFHPENKLLGFREAVKNGCDMIECDLRLSADYQPVIIHDRTINRTTNGRGFVSKMKLIELQYYGVPSLEDFMMWCQEVPHLYCAFELKDIGQKNIALLDKTLSILTKYNMQQRSMIISFNQKIVATSKMLCPDICTGLILLNSWLGNPINTARKLEADVLWIHHTFLPVVIRYDNDNMPLFVWTVNNRKQLTGIDKNVAGIVSDDLKTLFNQ